MKFSNLVISILALILGVVSILFGNKLEHFWRLNIEAKFAKFFGYKYRAKNTKYENLYDKIRFIVLGGLFFIIGFIAFYYGK
ncbi:MAG: hypothetical protein KKF44_06605 [Nanoarchaeota archaeon]|nr:hypothetical protein [Nanoarchaeota archaeon]